MLTLINTNRMMPPIAPVGLDYVAAAVRRAGTEVDLVDLCLDSDRDDEGAPASSPSDPAVKQAGPQTRTSDEETTAIRQRLAEYFARRQPALVGLTFRNVDDCFWPSGASFVPQLCDTVAAVRALTAAPIVLGGVGYSVFAREILERTVADFGICGDGEQAMRELLFEFRGRRRLERIGGLLWRKDGTIHANPPAWPRELSVPPERNAVDNAAYFRLGGQIGVETKRGCNRTCTYCIDPLAKGPVLRMRQPGEVAEEIQSLLQQGVDVLHLCDAEFNIPPDHARAVCDELVHRRLGDRVRWYAYLAVVPFDADLARRMAQAGCAGINFTSDSANAAMLATYGQPHRQEHLAAAVRLCRENGIAVMLDLLLGGPGETPETLAESIRFFQKIDPDCVGAALGVRLYPGTALADHLAAEGPVETNPSIRRRYSGPIDLVQPTFYISASLGENPARLVHDLVAGDPRFFEAEEETPAAAGPDLHGDHNYNANQTLADAIAAGARGAYWDILRKLRLGGTG
jgi:tryptophan 2-C-methyltransferase